MAQGFLLHCTPTDDASQGTVQLSALPIRIGRNSLNDCKLAWAFVSDFHARIDDVDGRISIRDLNSKNGVFVRQEGGPPLRIPAGTPVDLGQYGGEFYIGPHLRLRLERVEVDSSAADRDRFLNASVLGNRQMLQSGMPPVPGAAPSLPPLAPLPVHRVSNVRDTRDRRSQPPASVSYPPASASYPPPPATAHFSMSMEALALMGLRELAASLLPGQPLESTGDVARLITKLHDAVEIFCRCFIPLREGHSEFTSSLDLRRAASQRSQHRSKGYVAVENAGTPQEVAAALLDFHDPSLEAAKALEGIFADLMLHQVALLEGVMRGVRALLEELSPEGIETAVDSSRSAIPLNLGRHKALWALFCQRYEELSGEKQALMHIFGPEFAEAYSEYGRKRQT